ncbi:hypothetical protein [Cyanobium sp. NIES-981]|uniref:hypothetical protein n=1 Tax=Cyanobium sp. NIES-981 TaxID=1851505 RepID=UPI0007DD1C0C|nr:hypothetical protein [Cyanobium sp. NIES-981]SBO42036.1 Permease [Cyanobium sp. NIES-981]
MAFLLELVPALVAGLAMARRWPHLSTRVAPLLVRWGVPFSVMGLLLRTGVDGRFVDVLLITLALVASALVLLQRLPVLRRALPGPVEQWGAVVGNTAYFGIPAALALLPAEAVAYCVSYDLAATLFTWSLGPVLFGGQPAGPRALVAALAASPALRGLGAALVVQLTPWRESLAAMLWWPARLVLLLSLLVVGLRMGGALGAPLARRLWWPLGGKLLVFPACVLALTALLALPPLVRAALVLQAATPTAVSVLLLAELRPPGPSAEQERLNRASAEQAAALVLWSTLLGLVTVPLWASLLTA